MYRYTHGARVVLALFLSFGCGHAEAEEPKARRTGLVTYTIAMSGSASGANGEQKWTSKTDRVLRVRVPIEFWTDFSVEADIKAHEEARARRSDPAPAPSPAPPPISPALSAAIQSCSAKPGSTGMMGCLQEAATKICETAKADDPDRDGACVFARNLKVARDTPTPSRPKPQPLARNGEIWKGRGCEFSTTIDDQSTGTRPYDPLTRGPYVSKSFTRANWSSRRDDTCADVSIDKLARTIKLILPLPRDVKSTIRYESPVQNMEETRTLAPFKEAGLPGPTGEAVEFTAALTDLKTVSGSGTYTPKGSGASSVQTTLNWSVTLD